MTLVTRRNILAGRKGPMRGRMRNKNSFERMSVILFLITRGLFRQDFYV